MTDALTAEESARYEWQTRTPDVGEAGQRKLRAARVLVSRVGGVGGAAAYYLAAAGIGKLVLAHAGNVKPSDLNRQILITPDWLGKPRTASPPRKLRDLNPNVEIETIAENITPATAANLIGKVDV